MYGIERNEIISRMPTRVKLFMLPWPHFTQINRFVKSLCTASTTIMVNFQCNNLNTVLSGVSISNQYTCFGSISCTHKPHILRRELSIGC